MKVPFLDLKSTTTLRLKKTLKNKSPKKVIINKLRIYFGLFLVTLVLI